jgi:hypothetical protein
MPSNSTWVCFDCRTALRRSRFAQLADRSLACPGCGRRCVNLGKKIAIPPKSNTREWKALQNMFREWRAESSERIYEAKVRLRHKLERQIAAVKAMPFNEGRQNTIRDLKAQLAEL